MSLPLENVLNLEAHFASFYRISLTPPFLSSFLEGNYSEMEKLNGTLDRSVIGQIYLSFFPSFLTFIRKMDYIFISLFAPLYFFIFLTPFVNLSRFHFGPRTWLNPIFSKTSPIRSSDLSSSRHERASSIYEKSLYFKGNDR